MNSPKTKPPTIIFQFEEDRTRYIHRHDTWPDMLDALQRIATWTKGHDNGTCEAVHEKAMSVLGKINEA